MSKSGILHSLCWGNPKPRWSGCVWSPPYSMCPLSALSLSMHWFSSALHAQDRSSAATYCWTGPYHHRQQNECLAEWMSFFPILTHTDLFITYCIMMEWLPWLRRVICVFFPFKCQQCIALGRVWLEPWWRSKDILAICNSDMCPLSLSVSINIYWLSKPLNQWKIKSVHTYTLWQRSMDILSV